MFFWLIVGFLLATGAIYVKNRSDITLAWYDWVMLALAVIFFMLAISNYSDSMKELESRAANFLLLSFGIPGLLLVAIVGIRIWRQLQNVGTPPVETSDTAAS
jgi:hypothetical protein